MDTEQIKAFLGLGMIVLFAAGWIQGRVAKNRWRKRLQRLPSKTLDQAAGGEGVRVVGVVCGSGEALCAPMSGERCVAWFVDVEELVGQGRRSSWQLVVHDERVQDFALATDDGTLSVSNGLTLEAHLRPVYDKGGEVTVARGPEVGAFLRQRNIEPGKRRLRVIEMTISDGDELLVGTRVGREHANTSDDRQEDGVYAAVELEPGAAVVTDDSKLLSAARGNAS